ncbi:Gfo/Idh/MocA family protein [Parasedimentitalea psychrophila]|uniref:Gfo/Idh/MocA family oxidoreductase n=1 Tax=Parasedimentitalea psychrophila TaxID=2997337 RepID=A0A9Y2L472_9RHOB|nr:Gfo/Idh/MocA family oxidoreductase [Parasedimentitalea psychrophila]WIY27282.1 Gfo/Idh/MocA family oxidoreductase [Parasedimentitalea psychrophila]
MLRWAVLGTGFISNTVARAIQQSEGSELWTVSGRNPSAVQAFQEQFSIPNHSIGYDGALNDPNVDVAYIGLPNHLHHTLTAQAAAQGKAVLSEKSLTTTMAQAHELVSAVQQASTFFVEGYMYLAHPLYQRLQELLLDGRLGELRAIHGHYAADIWQVTNPQGRGTLYNLGCYPVSLMHLVVQTMCGEDMFASRRLAGFGAVSAHDGTICDAAMTARFDNGVLASLQSTDSYGMAHGFTISGTKGELRFVTNPWLPSDGANHLQWCPYDGAVEDIFVETGFDAFYHQIKMVEQNLTQGRTEAQRPSPRLQDSLEIMEFLTEWEALCLQGAAPVA